MKEKLKKQNGIGAIAIIIIVVLAVVIGGVSFLGIKSVVTGEPFLQPFADMGLIEIEEDSNDEKETDKDEKETDNDEEKNSEADKEDGVIHYHGELDFDKYIGGSSLDYSKLIKISVDFYATETDIVEMVMVYNLKDFLVKYYEEYKDDMMASGFSTYDSFRNEMMKTFETSFSSGFTSSSGSAIDDFFNIEYPEKEIIEMHITEGGIEQMYQNYSIENGGSIQEIINGFETALGIELEEV